MFTGLVQELGTVAGMEPHADALRLSIRAPRTVAEAALGIPLLSTAYASPWRIYLEIYFAQM